MPIPQRISPCPIIEAIVEIRFESVMPPDAVFGVLYNEFKSDYSKVEKLPILQLPETVRNNDINLKFQPHYKLIHDNYLLQIGPNVLSVVNNNNYAGWKDFSLKITDTFSQLNKLSLVKNTVRLGIRYINFFKLDIYENINLLFLLNNDPLIAEQTLFRCTLKTGNFLTNLQIANNAEVTVQNVLEKGSVIDIDTYFQKKGEDNLDLSNIVDILEEGHLEEKKLFFSLLNNDFLSTFNPEY